MVTLVTDRVKDKKVHKLILKMKICLLVLATNCCKDWEMLTQMTLFLGIFS